MFDWRIYLHNYPDLTKNGINSETKAVEHWKTQGIKERRVADKLLNTDEFNWVIYLNNNPDLVECDITSEKEALQHWLIHGKNENRIANKDIVGHIYNKTTTIKSNENDNEFIKLSLKYLKLVRILPVPSIIKDSIFEAVFIEYKRIPYCEFTIRNTIFKLGEKWSHTIICGNSNYEYMSSMCKLISPNIRVVQTNYDSMNENEYNKLLLSMEFWNLLHGSKILIYKKKSLIFKNNVEDMIKPLNRYNIQYGWYVYINKIKTDFGGVHITLEESKNMAVDFIYNLKKQLLAKHLVAGNPFRAFTTTHIWKRL